MLLRPALVTLLAFALSGCVGGSDVPEAKVSLPLEPKAPAVPTGLSSNASQMVAPEGGPPAWRVGDWWKYNLNAKMTGVEEWQNTLVVAGESPEAFLLGADTDKGVNQSFLIHVPELGPVRKSDYAVSRHGQPVAFVQWPLAEDKKWSTEIPGRGTWDATVKRVSTMVAQRNLMAWQIDYTQDGRLQHRIQWSPFTGWWVLEEVWNGDVAFRQRLTLADWGHNRTGVASYFLASDLYIGRHAHNLTGAQADPVGAAEFRVEKNAAHWLVLGAFHGYGRLVPFVGYGECSVTFSDPTGNPANIISFTGPCSGDLELGWTTRAMVEGTWRTTWTAAALQQDFYVEAIGVTMQRLALPGPTA